MSKLLLIKAKGTLPIMICFALAVVITGCDNVRQRQSVPTKNAASAVKTETPNRPQNEVEKKQADPLLKSQVKSRIEKIYSDIFSLGPSKRLELEDKYLTKDFKEILTKAELMEIGFHKQAIITL